jgi:hypothetical protein
MSFKQRAAIDGGIVIAVPILLLKALLGTAFDAIIIGGSLSLAAAIIAAAVGTDPGAAALRTGLWSGGLTAALSATYRLVKIVKAVAEFRRKAQVEIALAMLDREDPQ